MLDNDRGCVALFIDWDNLAISIAADLGGATPDLKRIVQKAQQYGTVLVAKAYAEWQLTSDRLAVYRAGVEPVYAPTFRFEPDLVGQPPRGKSLADPCLVADCVDCLHLFPQITSYVLVSGDKDLIPVVRLAQLRGKNVVVIGPDYAAGVLREMADEFVSYRQLIEEAEPHEPALETLRREPARPVRRHVGGREMAATPSAPRASRGAPSRERAAAPVPEAVAPVIAPEPLAAPVPSPEPKGIAPTPAPSVAAAETARREPSEELKDIFRIVAEVLAERSQDGRARLRATNLKDILMQRVPGFNERRYGFTKFKDLLLAARRAGMVDVTQAGPVHWVSLPAEPAPTHPEAAPLTHAEPVASAASAVAPTAAPEAPEAELVTLPPGQALEVTEFIYELGKRSRWLTYTYVLTNLISHLGRNLTSQAADAAARGVLSYLVQESVLRVDREPREVEVGGIKHRVRMCHLEESHPLVKQIVAAEAARAEAEAPSYPTEAPTESASVEGAEAPSEPETGLEVESQTSELTAPEREGTPEAWAPAVPKAPAEAGVEASGVEAPVAQYAEPQSPEGQAGPPEKESQGVPQEPEAEADRRAEGPVESPGHNGHAEASHVTTYVETTAPLVALTESEAEETSEAKASGEGGPAESQAQGIAPEPPPLERTFSALGEIVRASIGPERPRVRAAGLKLKLSRALGRFNERDYGFVRFKDYLLAAEREGWVQAQVRGANTWVAPGARIQSESAADGAE